MFTAYVGARGSGKLHFLTRRYGYERMLLEAIRMKVKNPLWKEADDIIARYIDWMRTEREIYLALRQRS